MYSSLVIKAGNRLSDLAAYQLLHSIFQLWIALPHNLIKLCCLHSCFLKLSKGPSCLDRLMLPRIAN